MQRLMSVLLVVVAACGGDGGSPMNFPDASGGGNDAASSSDASIPAQGIKVDWAAVPNLPGQVSSTVTVTSVKFHVKKLEVLGDAGSLPETSDDDFDLVWTPISPVPPPLYFTAAPPAVYSKVRVNLDKGSSNAPSVEILGTTTANGSTEMFEITSEKKLDLELSYQQFSLVIGDSRTIQVSVGLDAGLEKIEWGAMRTVGGVRTLEDTDTQAMDSFFDDLEDVFSASVE